MRTITKRCFLFTTLLSFASVFSNAQNKDCKFKKAKDPASGKIIQMVQATATVGNFFTSKRDEKYYITYVTKAIAILGSNTANWTELRIDSLRFYFVDKQVVTVPATGAGKIQNEVKLKNVFNYVQLEAPLEQTLVTKILESPLAEIQIFGEKQAVTRDVLNEKQQDALKRAFTCVQ